MWRQQHRHRGARERGGEGGGRKSKDLSASVWVNFALGEVSRGYMQKEEGLKEKRKREEKEKEKRGTAEDEKREQARDGKLKKEARVNRRVLLHEESSRRRGRKKWTSQEEQLL